MLDKLLAFVSGREPVATATGIAAVITAGLGLGAAFGLGISAEQIAAVGALAAALAGWAARRAVSPIAVVKDSQPEAGSIPLALLIMIAVGVVLIGGIAVSCDALFENESERNDLGLVAYHEECDPSWDDCGGSDYSSDYSSDDRNRNRGRDRGAFSPGPFRDSPIEMHDVCISLDCSGRPRREEPPPEER